MPCMNAWIQRAESWLLKTFVTVHRVKVSVSNFNRHLERTYRLAYGRDGLLTETQDALLHGQLQESLKHHLMEAPAVSGTSTYSMLCQAEKRQKNDGKQS